jgi:plasmid stabilization system protein ParE
MVAVTWTPDALADLEAITAFIGRSSSDYAPEFARKILASVRHLSDFPQIGRQVPELGMPSVREIVFQRYRVIYEAREDAVWILAVMHGAQDFATLAERRQWNVS